MEQYGLLGIFLTLTAIFAILDLGLGNALNRQLAQYSVQPGKEQDAHDLLRTLESIYWLVGIVIGVVTVIVAPLIAEHWVRANTLTTERVSQSLAMMGIAIAVQWPRALYTGGLQGIQQQVLLSVVATVSSTVLAVGGVLILWLISPTVEALIAWTIGVSLVETIATRAVLLGRLPIPLRKPAFSKSQLHAVWRFAAGMTGISIMAVILGQLDKVILSKLLTLEAFGYYSLAWRVVSGLYVLVAPIQSAFFPRLTQLAAMGDHQEVAHTYHRGTRLMAVSILPVAVILTLFARELLELWTMNVLIANNTGLILAVLAAGTAINGLMNMPISVQLAYGWTRLALFSAIGAVIVLAPLMWFVSARYGGLGAAYVWLAFNLCYGAVTLWLMHLKLLRGHLGQWLVSDIAPVLAVTLLVAGAWKLAIPAPVSYLGTLIGLVAVSLLTALAALLVVPEIRTWIARRAAAMA